MLGKENPYRALEKGLGYRFKNRTLLEQAFVHPSYRYESGGDEGDNQRLEFLGDAVLGLLTASYLYEDRGQEEEGGLTQRRSQGTSGKALAGIASRAGMGGYLKMGKGEARSGGRSRQRNLADALEALFGAAWLDGGLRAVEKLFEALLVPVLREQAGQDMRAANPKGLLQELVQSRWKEAPVYTLESTSGPAHEAIFEVSVRIPDGRSWKAQASGRQAAEVTAAGRALRALDIAADGQ